MLYLYVDYENMFIEEDGIQVLFLPPSTESSTQCSVYLCDKYERPIGKKKNLGEENWSLAPELIWLMMAYVD